MIPLRDKVDLIETAWIPMPDGRRLAARLFLPKDAEERPVPAILEYIPYRRRDGELLVLFMFLYAIHRFLNESLRNDTDPVAFGLTLSQNISIGVFLGGMILAYFVWRRPAIGAPAPPENTFAPDTLQVPSTI